MRNVWLRRGARFVVGGLLAAAGFWSLKSDRSPEDADEAGVERKTEDKRPAEEAAKAPGEPVGAPGLETRDAPAAGAAAVVHARPRGTPRTDSLKINDVPAPGEEPKPVVQARSGGPGFTVSGGGASSAASYAPGAGPSATQAAQGENAEGASWNGGAGPKKKAAAATTSGGAPGAAAEAGKSTASAEAAAEVGKSESVRSGGHGGWSSEAQSLLGQAKTLKPESHAQALERGIMSQIAAEQTAQSAVRSAISSLQAQGKPVTDENIKKEAAGALAAAGVSGDERATKELIESAKNPQPEPPPAALQAAVKNMVAQYPADPKERERLAQAAEAPKKPMEAPPKDALALYQKHRDVFEKAQKDFGVKPDHILGILRVESGLFRNIGQNDVVPTLFAIQSNRPGSSAARQAGRDLATLPQLEARGDLGPFTTKKIPGSTSGAISGAQFLPSSVRAYGRSPDGKGQNLFDQRTAIYSIANYLKAHGYRADDPAAVRKAIFGYNHADWYVNKVLANSPDMAASK